MFQKESAQMDRLKTSRSLALLIGLMMADQAGIARSVKLSPLDGTWGGDRMNLEVSRSGGKLETDCGSGTFPGAIKLAADGSFSVRGWFYDHQIGPQKAHDIQSASAARFHGRLSNGLLHLSISNGDIKDQRHYALRKNAHVKLVRCY
jgi:hypothetical protein